MALQAGRAKLQHMRVSLLALTFLAACHEQSVTADDADSPKAVLAERVPVRLTAVGPKADSDDDLYEFDYAWSPEAAAIPELAARFGADMEKLKAELVSGAKADRDERAKVGYDYHPHSLGKVYETAGQSDRLLSLEMSVYGFTGGAHGSTGSGSILWDRRLEREVSLQELLRPEQSWTGAIHQPVCVLLNREREKRRQEPVKPDDLFGNCPEMNELTVLLSDNDKNGRFDHVKVIADQYVAGPYAEGPYDILLPITAKMIERLKPEYASSFEPRPPVS